MKIFILCDLEGAAGVVDFHKQTYADAVYYEQSKRLCTLELNALIDGCLEAGAKDIVVLDGHGPGGLDVELLHREAHIVMGRPVPLPWGLDASFDALLLYGHHAMNNVPTGVLCHSWSSKTIANCWLNGDLIGEIGVNAAIAGYFSVPTVFISGDAAACEEARRYVPGIECVATKEGLSRTSAVSLSPVKARELLSAGGQRALARIREFEPFRIAPPYEFKTEALAAETAAQAATRPGVQRLTTHIYRVAGDDLLDVLRKR